MDLTTVEYKNAAMYTIFKTYNDPGKVVNVDGLLCIPMSFIWYFDNLGETYGDKYMTFKLYIGNRLSDMFRNANNIYYTFSPNITFEPIGNGYYKIVCYLCNSTDIINFGKVFENELRTFAKRIEEELNSPNIFVVMINGVYYNILKPNEPYVMKCKTKYHLIDLSLAKEFLQRKMADYIEDPLSKLYEHYKPNYIIILHDVVKTSENEYEFEFRISRVIS